MKNTIHGIWGGTNLYNIRLTDEKESVHPDDWPVLETYPYLRSLHQCTGAEGEYVIIRFGTAAPVRIKPYAFVPLDQVPELEPLQEVNFQNSKGVTESGRIAGIFWHNRDREFYYHIETGGQLKTRRYRAGELKKVS